MKATLAARALLVSALSIGALGCGGSPATAPSSAPPAPPAAPEDAGAPEPAPAASAEAPQAPAEPPGPVITSPETGASGVTSVQTSGSDAPDECSKAAAPLEEKVRPALNKCYQEGKKKNPDLSGTVRVAVNVNAAGKVISVKPSGTSELGDSVVQCMVKAVREMKLDGGLCKSKTVIVSKTYGKKQ